MFMTPRAYRDAEYLQRRLGVSRTDAVNQAVQYFARVYRQIDDGVYPAEIGPNDQIRQIVLPGS